MDSIKLCPFFIFIILSFSGFAYSAPDDQSHDGPKVELDVLSNSFPAHDYFLYISATEEGPSGWLKHSIKAVNPSEGRALTILEVGGVQIYSITPLQDGKSFVFSVGDISDGDRDDKWMSAHLWLYSDGSITQLTSGMVRDTEAVLSENANKIYFTRSIIEKLNGSLMGHAANICEMDMKSGKISTLFEASKDIGNMFPTLKKGDDHIYFSSNREGMWGTFFMNQGGGEIKPFISNIAHSRWSPDGRYIAYVDTIPGNIYIANEQGETIKKLTDDKLTILAPVWSSDSQSIYFSKINPKALNNSPTSLVEERETHTDVWRMDISDSDNPLQVTSKGLANSIGAFVDVSETEVAKSGVRE